MKQLLREKVPKAQIARQLGISRQTIYNWIDQPDNQPSQCQRPSKLDPFKPYIQGRLERFNLPAAVLLREIREQGYDGGITILRGHVARIKDKQVARLVDRFETEPGRQAQVDWASCGTIIHNGRRRRLSLLSVVFGYSRFIWARFVVSERRPVLMELLEQCFREVGGIPNELLFDNLKQVVAQPRTKETPARIQTSFGEFANHWGFDPIASPPYWPQAKGKVERSIQYMETSFLEGRSFTDIDDLNGQLCVWLALEANVRTHGTTKERPIDRLAADLAGMMPVAHISAFPSVLKSSRLADHDGRISYQGVSYSVDPDIISGRRGTSVEVRESADHRLLIFHEGQKVGDHALVPSGSPPQDNPLHAKKRREKRQRPTLERPKGKMPRFDQQAEEDACKVDLLAPEVRQRPLSEYEVSSCRPS